MDGMKICFVIMPISDVSSYEDGHFSRVYEYIIKPAIIKAGFAPLRADEVINTNYIIADILKQIVSSSMCICDLSTRNPNVLYELGIRHAFRLPVTLIRDSKTPRIFDIQGLRDIEYNVNLRIDNVNSSIDKIAETIINTYESRQEGINSLIDLIGIEPIYISCDNNRKEYDDLDDEKYNLKFCIEEFIKYKEQEGLLESSVSNYKYQLQHLADYCSKRVNEITAEDIRTFLDN